MTLHLAIRAKLPHAFAPSQDLSSGELIAIACLLLRGCAGELSHLRRHGAQRMAKTQPSLPTLGSVLRSIDKQEQSWPPLALPMPPMSVSREQRIALATYVEQHLDSQAACQDAAAELVLSVPPAGPEVPRWQTSGLP